ncbi:hypothetical protein RHSIM_Rhsim12G0077100 [Rhododendron simsii]|uniref:Glycosyltransferase 61 catalytic domain-containing protein n=1 Tax=Rhododendron simsii TaxID=118357 RepID=A0A834G2M9_RHOSS|nr:hypothetical protein RHSIM_Rhsim12G0077100 [Rhododendron simsii]
MPGPINCHTSYGSYNLCSISSPTVLDPKVVTFYDLGPTNLLANDPRNRKTSAMARIKEATLASGPIGPHCTVRHNSPALLFSVTGSNLCTGNFFHAFNDGFIPLFITVNSVFPKDEDRVLVISTSCDWWVQRYVDLLQSFSKHRIITIDNDTATHCFPSATVGLVSHGFMTIEPQLMPNSKTLLHFHALLDKIYGQKLSHPPTTSISPISNSPRSRPRFVLATRSNVSMGRVILNQAELRNAVEEEGFEVIEFEPKVETPLREIYKLISSSHVLVGVHGATLTNLLFLRPGSVVVQVVPIGVEWIAGACFGKPANDMGLEYMEYKIGVEETSLREKYGKDDLVIKDPLALQRKGWSKEIMDIYLVEQNVKLDLVRFRRYLKKANEKARVFMEREG